MFLNFFYFYWTLLCRDVRMWLL